VLETESGETETFYATYTLHLIESNFYIVEVGTLAEELYKHLVTPPSSHEEEHEEESD
jgi:hypothetical protein